MTSSILSNRRRHQQWALAVTCAGGLVLAGCASTPAVTAASASTAASTSASTSAPSTSATVATTSVTMADSWVKSTSGTADPSMTAAFGVLTNSSDKDITVVSAVTDASDHTELHEMAMVGGAMVMRPITGGIKIPANGTAVLAPGGLHVMIMDVTKDITPGDDVHVTLTLSDGSTLTFDALAKAFAGANESYDPSASSMGTPMGSVSATTTTSEDSRGQEATRIDG